MCKHDYRIIKSRMTNSLVLDVGRIFEETLQCRLCMEVRDREAYYYNIGIGQRPIFNGEVKRWTKDS